jgi:hypothetical protein
MTVGTRYSTFLSRSRTFFSIGASGKEALRTILYAPDAICLHPSIGERDPPASDNESWRAGGDWSRRGCLALECFPTSQLPCPGAESLPLHDDEAGQQDLHLT